MASSKRHKSKCKNQPANFNVCYKIISKLLEQKHIYTLAQTIPYTVKIAFKSAPFLFICLIVITLFSGLIPTSTVYVGKLVLNSIVSVLQDDAGVAETRILIYALILQCTVFLGGAILEHTNMYVNFVITRRLMIYMQGRLLKKTSELDYSYFDDSKFYDMMRRAKNELGGKPSTIIARFTTIVRGGITFISMSVLATTLSLWLLVVMLLICIPLLIVRLKYSEKSYKLACDYTENRRLSGQVSGLMTEREYIPELTCFGLWDHMIKKWRTADLKYLGEDIKLVKRQTLAELFTKALINGGSVGVTGYIIYMSINKGLSLTVGDIMMYAGAFTGGVSGLVMMIQSFSDVYESSLFINNYVEYEKIKPNIEVKGKGRVLQAPIKTMELQNVSFRYPGNSRYVLRNIDVKLNCPGSILIVGANGAGKTTLIKMLTRLYDPTEGRILVNGLDIREYEIESVRKIIGVIFQNYIHYPFSVKENIGCGDISDLDNNIRLINAAKKAKVDSFIERLPRGYDTVLSRMYKDGHELSIGQWQRVCLARLFMKNAPVLILDEPTASLDVETEAHLLAEIAKLTRDKISILVSHRMFREGIADQVIVLKEGELVESGTFETLKSSNGEFSRLYKLYCNVADKQVIDSAAI